MSIEAEDVARDLEGREGCIGTYRDAHRYAALVRALEAVRVAADAYRVAATQGLPTHDKWVDMKEALAAVDRIKRGESAVEGTP